MMRVRRWVVLLQVLLQPCAFGGLRFDLLPFHQLLAETARLALAPHAVHGRRLARAPREAHGDARIS